MKEKFPPVKCKQCLKHEHVYRSRAWQYDSTHSKGARRVVGNIRLLFEYGYVSEPAEGLKFNPGKRGGGGCQAGGGGGRVTCPLLREARFLSI